MNKDAFLTMITIKGEKNLSLSLTHLSFMGRPLGLWPSAFPPLLFRASLLFFIPLFLFLLSVTHCSRDDGGEENPYLILPPGDGGPTAPSPGDGGPTAPSPCDTSTGSPLNFTGGASAASVTPHISGGVPATNRLRGHFDNISEEETASNATSVSGIAMAISATFPVLGGSNPPHSLVFDGLDVTSTGVQCISSGGTPAFHFKPPGGLRRIFPVEY